MSFLRNWECLCYNTKDFQTAFKNLESLEEKVNVKTKLSASAAAALLLAGGAVGFASPAQAAYGDPGYVVAPACVRYGPSYFYGIAYCTSYNAWLYLGCWTDDGQGRRWFSIAYQPQRWVEARNVTQQPSLAHC